MSSVPMLHTERRDDRWLPRFAYMTKPADIIQVIENLVKTICTQEVQHLR